MTQEERQAAEAAAEAVIRDSCAPFGAEVVDVILARVRALPDMEDGPAFAARVGDIVGTTAREWLAREWEALRNLHLGLDWMSATWPKGPVCMH